MCVYSEGSFLKFDPVVRGEPSLILTSHRFRSDPWLATVRAGPLPFEESGCKVQTSFLTYYTVVQLSMYVAYHVTAI